MANFRKLNVVAIAALAIAVTAMVLKLETTRALAVPPPQNSGSASGFLGAWCAQGDPTKRCSIGSNGVFLNFANESGSTASGHLVGTSQNVVIADEWDFVKGTLSNDGSQINWSNGTLLDEVRRRGWRRRPAHAESGWNLVSRRRSFAVLLHPAEEKESSTAQRKRPEWERLNQRASPCNHQLVRDTDRRDAQPRRRYYPLG